MKRAVFAVLVVSAAIAPPAIAASHVNQMVVFRSGHARLSHPSTAQTTVRVHRRRCAVASATPLAALVRSRVGPLSLRDYGSCSKRPADGSGLFVAGIGADHNRGSNGWVYKSGNVLGTAGAADPAGPLGRGRLRPGAHVTWFWCHVTARNGGCPHTLGVGVHVQGKTVIVHVRHFNDAGKGRAAVGAIVHVGRHSARTGRDGSARLRLRRGRYRVYATQRGRIRSFPASAAVR